MANPLRSRLRKTLLSGTDAKIARQQRQLDALAKQLAAQATKQSKQLEAIRARSAEAAEGGTSLAKSVEGLASRITALETGVTMRGIEVERRRAQLGAIEERLGRVDAAIATSGLGSQASELSPDEVTEATHIIRQIRREHEQIRIRMQIIASYEERLRRVEESLVSLYEGDERHQM